MKLLSLIITAKLCFFSLTAKADCLEIIDQKIKTKEEKLLTVKKKEKRILKITAASTFIPTTLFMGTMAKLIIDGGTIATAAVVGTGFGAVVAAGAVATVAVPMVTYNQIIKAQIKGMNKTHNLLMASANYEYQNPAVQKMYKKVKKMRPEIEIEQMVDTINDASMQDTFCSTDQKVYSLKMIKNYLAQNAQDEDSLILLD